MAIAYAPGLSGPFLFDDVPNITENQGLTAERHSFLGWWSAIQSSGSGALRRPLSMGTFALQISSEPTSATSLKAVNLLIHGVCGLLIYALAATLRQHWLSAGQRATRSELTWMPALAMAIWLHNPLLLSTTLYVVQRMAQLSALFSLAALLTYARARARWAANGAGPDDIIALGLWVCLFTILAVLSKENGVLLLWQLAVLEFCFFLGQWDGQSRTWIRRLGVALFCAPIILFLGFTIWQWDWIASGYASRDFSLAERLWTEMRLLWFYIGGFLLPRIGTYGLFHDDIQLSLGWLTPATTLISVLAWLAAITIGWRLRVLFPWLLFAVLFFLVGHSIESGYLALELVFEHRNYLPTAGIALAVAAGLALLIDRHVGPSRTAYQGLSAVYVAVLLSTLFLRSLSWSDELELATASVVRHPESARSTHFYANTLIKIYQAQGTEPSESSTYLAIARHEFEALLEKEPNDLSALVMLYTLDSQLFGEISEADRWLEKIEERVVSGVLQATDFAAMRVLNRCVLEGDCTVDRERFERLLANYSARVPNAVRSQLSLERAARLNLAPQERLLGIALAVERNPRDLSLYYPLISTYIELGDFGSAHAAIIEILERDSNHRQLSYVDALFARKEQGQ